MVEKYDAITPGLFGYCLHIYAPEVDGGHLRPDLAEAESVEEKIGSTIPVGLAVS